MSEQCPGCEAEGSHDDVLAPGQLYCPTDREECAVVTFWTVKQVKRMEGNHGSQ